MSSPNAPSGGNGPARAFVLVGHRLNHVLERLSAALLAVMVGIVWYGVLDRYYLHTTGAWTEEMSRYIMIWAVFLAVPCGVYYREHIGLTMILERFAPVWRGRVSLALDLIGLCFFATLFGYGVLMTLEDGPTNYTTLFGMTFTLPYASVPTCAGLCMFMIVVTMVRDAADVRIDEPKLEAPLP